MTAIYPEITFQHLQSLGDSVRLCDSEVVDGDLVSLYHYRQCDDASDSLLKQFRGIVFASSATGGEDTTKLVMRGFPYTPEIIVDSTNTTVLDDLTRLFPGSRFFESHEGTIIRVFYHKKWFVSTHKRLDGSTSRWGSNESFEDIFRRAIDTIGQNAGYNYETFFDRLDKSRQYMFLLRNTNENRIVSTVQPNTPLVYHVGTYIDNKLNIEDDIGIIRPKEIKIENPQQLLDTVLSMGQMIPIYFQGVFACGENGFYKLISGVYHKLSKVRGNEPNLMKRYLEVRKTEDFNGFQYLYGIDVGQKVETGLGKIARNIHMTYMKRFISKQYAVVDPSRYGVLKACHSLYLQNREPVTLDVVWQVLNSESVDTLYRMLSA